jgi:hypothetical protein
MKYFGILSMLFCQHASTNTECASSLRGIKFAGKEPAYRRQAPAKAEKNNKRVAPMSKKNNYLFLSGVFLVVYLVLAYTGIYGDSGWFKYFILILLTTFLVLGLSIKQKE